MPRARMSREDGLTKKSRTSTLIVMMKRSSLRATCLLLTAFTLSVSAVLSAGPFQGQVGIAIERTFSTGRAQHLKPYLPDSSRIFVAIPVAGIQAGNYSRNQILAALDQMFTRLSTRTFTLEGGRLPNLQRGPARARWQFRPNDAPTDITTFLYFTITSNPLKPQITSIRGEDPS